MRILISGGTGFIGNALAERCHSFGHDVWYTGRNLENDSPGTFLWRHDFVKLPWDLVKPDVVFHLAAITDTLRTGEEVMETNCHKAITLFKQANELNIPVIYASSVAVYGQGNPDHPFHEDDPLRPLNEYGQSKACLDQAAKELGVVGLRFTNVYGAKEGHKKRAASMIYQMITAMQTHAPTLFRWGQQSRDWVYISDVVDALLLAMEAKPGIYNIGSGTLTSFNRLTEIINMKLNTKWTPRYVTNPIEESYQDYNPVTIHKAHTELGYEPKYDIVKGISEIMQML